MPSPLIGRRIQNVRIRRIHHNIIDTGVLADGEHRLPGLAAIAGLKQSAVAARSPQRPGCRDVDDLRIPRINDHAPNML